MAPSSRLAVRLATLPHDALAELAAQLCVESGVVAAIGVRLILQGEIDLTGVHAPVVPEIYEPVLEELEQLGIHFTEEWETIRG